MLVVWITLNYALTDRILMVLHLIKVGMYLKRQALLFSFTAVEQ